MSGQPMRIALGVLLATLVIAPSHALAADGGNGFANGGTGASAGGGTVIVGAGSSGGTSSTGNPGAGAPTAGTSSESCTYNPLDPASAAALGVGGPTPGQWVEPYCTGPGYVNPMFPIWVIAGQTPQQARPVLVAQQALAEMTLPTPVISASPSIASDQIVRVPTWLWIDRGIWTPQSVTASAGGVTATATATPIDVVWTTGDGGQVVCSGPGVPYNAALSQSAQSTSCSYTWTRSSAGQPGNAFAVTATVEWRVTWTVVGAAGGGSLGVVESPPANAAFRVAEVQALNGPTT